VFTNSVGAAISNAVLLTVLKAPVITSVNHATFRVGMASSFTVVSSASPVATLSLIGGLPTGLSFTPNTANGTATISGTPATGMAGTSTLLIIADNDLGDAIQTFTLTIR
jgi:hypothetical protein